MYEITFITKKLLASNIWQFDFAKPPEGYDFIAGQYAHFYIPTSVGSLQSESRLMSFTSHPSSNQISFLTRISENPSRYKTRLSSLRKGEKIHVGEAMGDFILPRLTETELTFIAGGIGIASYLSILEDIRLTNKPYSGRLFYAVRSSDDKISISALGNTSSIDYREFISPRRLTISDILGNKDGLYYISGTESFVESLKTQLEKEKINHGQIIFDYFTGY